MCERVCDVTVCLQFVTQKFVAQTNTSFQSRSNEKSLVVFSSLDTINIPIVQV